ncbi:MAG: hypothetical protein ACRC6N_11165 [Plesiomonas sp.]|uniref:hypothetical protein n=1 Tax=Plesiomonas sp. TaxID=2486279 RepID=UPI003F304827
MSAWQSGGDLNNGWRRYPDGTIEQWGLSPAVTTQESQIRFHIPFTIGVCELNEHDSGNGTTLTTTIWQFVDVTPTGAIARNIGSLRRGNPSLDIPVMSACRWYGKGK